MIHECTLLAQRFKDFDEGFDWTNLLFFLIIIVMPALNGAVKWYKEKFHKGDIPPTEGESAAGSGELKRAGPTTRVPPVIDRSSRPRRAAPTGPEIGEAQRPVIIRSRPAAIPPPPVRESPERAIPRAIPVRRSRTVAATPSRAAPRIEARTTSEPTALEWHLTPAQTVRKEAREKPGADWHLERSSSTGPAPKHVLSGSLALQRLLQRDDISAAVVLSELLRPPLALRDADERAWC